MKPFHRQHPIRGAFGDPRSLRGSVDITADNPLSFHDGVDIQARDGTPVYAIEPGQVSIVDAAAVAVGTPFAGPTASVIFGYWHVVPVVRGGQYVGQSQLLGYVMPGAGHVHLSERRFGAYVNPLRRGGLAPFVDHTRPVIRGLIVYAAGTEQALSLDDVHGRVDVAVDAYDPPAMPTWGDWAGAIWSPARITWSGLVGGSWRPLGGLPQTVNSYSLSALDVRDVYAHGTLQNGPNFTGVDRFWLIRNLDTTTLAGDRAVTVTAEDTRGNRATRTFSLTID